MQNSKHLEEGECLSVTLVSCVFFIPSITQAGVKSRPKHRTTNQIQTKKIPCTDLHFWFRLTRQQKKEVPLCTLPRGSNGNHKHSQVREGSDGFSTSQRHKRLSCTSFSSSFPEVPQLALGKGKQNRKTRIQDFQAKEVQGKPLDPEH